VDNHHEDVLIIGGGIIGVTSAYYLAGRGRKVTILEQGNIADGSSYGNAGLIVPSHATPLPQPGALADGLKWMLDSESPFYIKPRLSLDLVRWLITFAAHCTDSFVRQALPTLRDLGLASVALFDDLSDLFDFGYRRKGLLNLFRTADALAHAAAEARLLSEAGLNARPVTAEEAQAIEPIARPDLAGGIYYETDALLNPATFVRGLAKWLEERESVRIHRRTRVRGIEKAGRRITRIKTVDGDFEADEVVVAAGAWSPGFARDLRLNIPIQPAKGYSITVKRPERYPGIGLLLGESRVAVTPMSSPEGDLLRFAGTLELSGLDFSINLRRVEAVRRAPANYLLGITPEKWETLEVWRGLRPCTPDGLPIVGRARAYDNLTLATGHAMVGISLGPITGKLVSQIVTGETPELDVRPLRVERF
jgi:D-amino-acid dehydrogenase